MTYTAAEKAQEVEREIKMRMHVYENLIGSKKISRATAEQRVAIMKEIAADYRAQAAKENLL